MRIVDHNTIVMRGLDPRTHVLTDSEIDALISNSWKGSLRQIRCLRTNANQEDVGTRVKPGHDDKMKISTFGQPHE